MNPSSHQDKLIWCRSEDAREPTIMPKTKKIRDEAKYRVLPPLDAETYAGLRANIALNGVQVPVVKDERGFILDGFARAQIAEIMLHGGG